MASISANFSTNEILLDQVTDHYTVINTIPSVLFYFTDKIGYQSVLCPTWSYSYLSSFLVYNFSPFEKECVTFFICCDTLFSFMQFPPAVSQLTSPFAPKN